MFSEGYATIAKNEHFCRIKLNIRRTDHVLPFGKSFTNGKEDVIYEIHWLSHIPSHANEIYE